MTPHDIRARGDRELAERLRQDREIRAVIERVEKAAAEHNARRQLLGTAMRLSPEMAPDVHDIMTACRTALGIEAPVETYVYPAPVFNAAAVRPERGLLLVLLSSSLLEAFEPSELQFVIGHELGHHLFEHHKIPVGAILSGAQPIGPGLALQMFAWQRYAEISSDRAGLVCAGGFEPAAHALFKLASGLRGGRIRILIDKFVSQAADLQTELERPAQADERMRSDWFSTHPFSPLRLRAAELFAQSTMMVPGGLSQDDLEAQVQELMALMDPRYLQERSEAAEAMRRLLFAGALLIATSAGAPNKQTLAALEQLLGPGSIPPSINVPTIEEDLPRRIAQVNDKVPTLRRVQVIRDLCVIARADNHMAAAELQRITQIATAIGVDTSVIDCTVCGATELD